MSIQDANRSIDGLTYTTRCAWLEHQARCAERRVWLIFLESLRSPRRLEWLIANGRSWSKRSYHLAAKEDGKSAAYDAAPILRIDGGTLKVINWNAAHPHWQIYAEEADKLGLECGATWKQKDWSHCQLQRRR